MDGADRAQATIFTGRFGSGKTEAALNFAISLARGVRPEGFSSTVSMGTPMAGEPTSENGVILIDLDLVTPYFRSREAARAAQRQGVEVIAPSVIGQHLDTPAVTPEILGAIQQHGRPLVLDVGGDRQGARALGQFSSAIADRGYVMHFVVNPYRPFTDSLDGLAASIAEIEASSRLVVTSLVSNPNLIGETTAKTIADGHARIKAYARALELPIAFVCLERRWASAFGNGQMAQPVLTIDRFFVMSWEKESAGRPGIEAVGRGK